ncbi:SDR family NAD(P)-dependent oxidoreductase [Dactylosporangium sp. CA-092794]|uniref:SDR family NAD(P)-dependent oxidoreductase n=1 Tax=Dactylosporangium sp. CA-092794 TaxID=3239929 RepID=UPI003D925795
MLVDARTTTMPHRTALDLTGRVALVTGASRGLGLAIADKLSRSGCEVLLNYVRDDASAQRAVRGLTGERAALRLVRADVGRPDEVRRLLADVENRHGRLDIFVHNASVFHPTPTADPDADACAAEHRVAVGPLLYGAGHLTRLMRPGTGRIIAISSSGGRYVVPGYLGLGMAKAALETLVRYLAVEVAGHGITVNAVAAGKLSKDAAGAASEAAARVVARTPAGRLTRPGEVADVVALLCRPEAAAVHGQVITVDGGLGLLA